MLCLPELIGAGCVRYAFDVSICLHVQPQKIGHMIIQRARSTRNCTQCGAVSNKTSPKLAIYSVTAASIDVWSRNFLGLM